MNKKIKILIIVALIAVIGIGVYFIYNSYMDSQYDENMKLAMYYHNSSSENINLFYKELNITYYNEKEFSNIKKQSLKYLNKSIEDLNKSIYYRQKMVDSATEPIEKEYATLMLQINEKSLKILYLLKNTVTNLNAYDSEDKYKSTLDKIEKIDNETEDLIKQKDELKLKNLEFNKRIQKLDNETKI